jgi:flagellum-specific peptidoglycan hydrolase FlgJ
MKATIIFLFCLLSLQTGATTRGEVLKQIDNKKASLFLNKHWNDAEEAAKEYNVPLGLLLAQAAFESGWGTSRLATENCNLLGLKKRGNYAEYENFLECFRHYGRTLNQPCYKEIPTTSLNLWLYQLDHCKYHSDKSYSKHIKRIYYGFGLDKIDNFKK